jgi:hypothetical protein
MNTSNTITRQTQHAAHAEGTAADAYAKRLHRCAMMADWLGGELAAHAERAAAAPASWGFAGDLGEAERLLAEVLARLIGTTTADVAATVDEAVPGSGG